MLPPRLAEQRSPNRIRHPDGQASQNRDHQVHRVHSTDALEYRHHHRQTGRIHGYQRLPVGTEAIRQWNERLLRDARGRPSRSGCGIFNWPVAQECGLADVAVGVRAAKDVRAGGNPDDDRRRRRHTSERSGSGVTPDRFRNYPCHYRRQPLHVLRPSLSLPIERPHPRAGEDQEHHTPGVDCVTTTAVAPPRSRSRR